VDEPWEAIPTTNESYGYHKYDSSHKPVAHFIQLLASAVAKGGNLLMNIGPKGDGAFDQRDLTILNGIGKWTDKNRESIYGASAGPLPFQNWGVSTMKGNKIYLHVFHWPADGKLYVGGLVSEATKAYLLATPSKSITIQHEPTGDLRLLVPAKAPDPMNTVIVLEYKGKIRVDSVRFIPPAKEVTRLLAFDAAQKGKGFNYGDGKTDRYYVEGWAKKEQSLNWELRIIKQANYKIVLKYLAPAESSGGSYELTIGQKGKPGKALTAQNPVITGPKVTTVVTQEAGVVTLTPGTYTLDITPVIIQGTELMKLLEIQLMPSDNK